MFAGYGGASFALRKAGIEYECVGFSEIYEPGIKTFKLNHGDVKNYGDCTQIVPEQLPDFDLLTGGFPCQPFSVNTRETARGEVHKSYNLFMDIIRILKYKRPRYILLENVKGIMGEKAKEVRETLIAQLRELGYDLRFKILNTKDHGLPQNRERVFFVGKLGHWTGNPFKDPEFEFPLEEELKLSVRDLLEDGVERREPQIKNYELNKQCNLERYGNITRFEAILQTPVKKKGSNVAFEILDAPSNVVSRQCDRIYHPTFAPCLTATGKDYLFYVDGKVIVLTPRECFRLMGFLDDEIKLPEDTSESQQHHLAGNGWDINLVSKIFKRMFKDKQNINIDKRVVPLNV